MKKNFCFLNKFIIIVFIIFFLLKVEGRSRRSRKKDGDNKQAPYPHPAEAPTSSDQVKTPLVSPPLISKSLDELDPSKGITKELFMSTIQFSLYQIDRSQMELIFVFTDKNHNDILERQEWEQFVTLYILPFEACRAQEQTKDQSGSETNGNNYLLSVEQYKTCFQADPKTSKITFRELDQQRNPFQIIKNIISLESQPGINFYQYLFTRLAIFGWFQCTSSNSYISKNDFNCAISHVVPMKQLTNQDKENIYNTGLRFQFNDNSLIQLDFLSFLRIAHYTNIYSIYEKTNDFSSLSKSDFLKALQEGRQANGILEDDVNNFYSNTNTNPHKNSNQINFETFSFFFHFHKLFERYSKERPLQLNKTEFLSLLNDDETPIKIVMAIDSSLSNFEQPKYQEASLILQRLRPRENDFFYSFRTKHKTKLKKHKKEQNKETPQNTKTVNNKKSATGFYYDHVSIKNQTCRETFFTIITSGDSQYLTHGDYFKGFQLANLFIDLSEKVQKERTFDTRPFYSSIKIENIISKIENICETANPPINLSQRKARDYFKSLPSNINLDLLTFIALFNFEYKIKSLTGSDKDETINEKHLKTILQSFGMKDMPDTVLDIAKKGNDQLNRRIYIIKDVIRNIIIVQAVASEQLRDTNEITKNGLKSNPETSRQFPDANRRFQSSPLV